MTPDRKPREADLYNPIILHCQQALLHCRLWRNGRPIRDERGRWHNNALEQEGMADLVGWVQGRWLEVEVKSRTGRQQESQRAHEALVRSQGGIYVVARSPEQAERLIREALCAR